MTGRAGTMATPARSGRALAAVAGQLERGVRHHFGRLPMIVLDERTQVKNAIRRWVHMYGLDGTYRDDKRSRRVGAELMALDQDTATAADVAEIIGNSSWVCERACDECGKETWEVVRLGEEPGYDSSTACVCRDCLRAALRLLGDA